MEIDWYLFLSALVVLYFPGDVFLRVGMVMKNFAQVRGDFNFTDPLDEWDWRQLAWLGSPRLWLDTARAYAGCHLVRMAVSFDPFLPLHWAKLGRLGVGVVLLVGVGLQMHTRRCRYSVLVPLGYVVGMVFELLGPFRGGCTIAFAVMGLLGFRNWGAFFSAGALGAFLFGSGFTGYMWSINAALVMFVPPILAIMVSRELALPVKAPVVKVGDEDYGPLR